MLKIKFICSQWLVFVFIYNLDSVVLPVRDLDSALARRCLVRGFQDVYVHFAAVFHVGFQYFCLKTDPRCLTVPIVCLDRLLEFDLLFQELSFFSSQLLLDAVGRGLLQALK